MKDYITEHKEAINAILDGYKEYEVAISEDGCIELDWHLDSGAMLTISFGKDFVVSGLHNKNTLMITASLGNFNLPILMRCAMEWLGEMDNIPSEKLIRKN